MSEGAKVFTLRSGFAVDPTTGDPCYTLTQSSARTGKSTDSYRKLFARGVETPVMIGDVMHIPAERVEQERTEILRRMGIEVDPIPSPFAEPAIPTPNAVGSEAVLMDLIRQLQAEVADLDQQLEEANDKLKRRRNELLDRAIRVGQGGANSDATS